LPAPGQYFPRPYTPSIDDAMRVSCSASWAFEGAASTSELRSSSNLRRSSGAIFDWSNCAASFTSCTVAVMSCSSAFAARISVSGVM
jgi:hypothetical protein